MPGIKNSIIAKFNHYLEKSHFGLANFKIETFDSGQILITITFLPFSEYTFSIMYKPDIYTIIECPGEVQYKQNKIYNSANFDAFYDRIRDWCENIYTEIKDDDFSKELIAKGVKLPQRPHRPVDIVKHNFDVSLSFPGELRSYIEPIVDELKIKIGPTSYFYDNNYKAQLARPSLDTLLQDIYKNRSKLIVVFLCEKYQEKKWCGIEFRAIKEIIMERQHERIMFVKMDDSSVDGVFKTDGYIDGRSHSATEVANFIKERIDLL